MAIVAEKIGFKPITLEGFFKLNVIIRKMAHGFQFLIFAVLLRFLLEHSKTKRENIVFYTLLAVIFFAVGDEVHQLFVSGRTPSVKDIIIDFSGGVVGVMLVSYINKISKKKIACKST